MTAFASSMWEGPETWKHEIPDIPICRKTLSCHGILHQLTFPRTAFHWVCPSHTGNEWGSAPPGHVEQDLYCPRCFCTMRRKLGSSKTMGLYFGSHRAPVPSLSRCSYYRRIYTYMRSKSPCDQVPCVFARPFH